MVKKRVIRRKRMMAMNHWDDDGNDEENNDNDGDDVETATMINTMISMKTTVLPFGSLIMMKKHK
jgi:hypothetical protein